MKKLTTYAALMSSMEAPQYIQEHMMMLSLYWPLGHFLGGSFKFQTLEYEAQKS